MDKDFVVFNKATILVTGGTGTVGRFFIDSLLKSNCSFKEIRVFLEMKRNNLICGTVF